MISTSRPRCSHYGTRGDGLALVPGMVFTIEPMINLGKKDLEILKDGWTVVTLDRSLSAQFEQTVLVTPRRIREPHPLRPLTGC